MTTGTQIAHGDPGHPVMTAPRIYVACLSSYVSGRLHGRWIDADQDPVAIRAEIGKMLAGSPSSFAEEWAIHDHDGFEGIAIGEHEPVERVAAIAALLAEHDADVIAPFINDWGPRPVDELGSAFRAAYAGFWPSREEFAREVLAGEGELAKVPEGLRECLELGRLTTDAEVNGELWTVETLDGIHVIHGNY